MTQDGKGLAASWEAFCAELGKAGAVLDRADAPHDAVTQAEGLRYLSRVTRAALDMLVESSDVEAPRFFQLSNETIKIGADNPDNIYLSAQISGGCTYRLWGNRGGAPYMSFGTKANRYAIDGTMASTGELEDKQVHFDADGNFEIFVSPTQAKGDWLPTKPDSTMLLVRQTFTDKSSQKPASVHIECTSSTGPLPPLTPEKITKGLAGVNGFVKGTVNTFADWSKIFMANPNRIMLNDQSFFQNAGGDHNIVYLFGYWKLQPDEAWVIETDVPECRFWNFILQNWWLESLDYRTNPNVWTNIHKAKIDGDGKLRIVVSPKPLGFGNWIDTAGHREGTSLLRWISAKSAPIPDCKVIKIG